jgi:predicted transcriptional regulator
MASRVEDVMTRDVISVRKDAEYKDILQVMRRERFSLQAIRRVDGVVAVREKLSYPRR